MRSITLLAGVVALLPVALAAICRPASRVCFENIPFPELQEYFTSKLENEVDDINNAIFMCNHNGTELAFEEECYQGCLTNTHGPWGDECDRPTVYNDWGDEDQ